MKKPILLAVAAACFISLKVNAQHTIEKVWATDTVLAVPESVLPEKDIMYVTLIDGEAWKKDSKGGVGKLTPAGKIIDTKWITGLKKPLLFYEKITFCVFGGLTFIRIYLPRLLQENLCRCSRD